MPGFPNRASKISCEISSVETEDMNPQDKLKIEDIWLEEE